MRRRLPLLLSTTAISATMLFAHLRGSTAFRGATRCTTGAAVAFVVPSERPATIRSDRHSCHHHPPSPTCYTSSRQYRRDRQRPWTNLPWFLSLESSSSCAENNNNRNNNSTANEGAEAIHNLLLTRAGPWHNDFFALRHGQSQANCWGIIASNPEIACHQYGLSELGQQQARHAGQDIVQHYRQHQQQHGAGPEHCCYDGLAVISSDLLRCRETAALVVEEIGHASPEIPLYKGAIVFDTRLRERNFGDWDGTSDTNYAKVWEADALDSSSSAVVGGVEAVDTVMQRATELVCEYNARMRNHMVVLTAHGDVLQILQTAFQLLPGTQHRSIPHLETATLRRLELKQRY